MITGAHLLLYSDDADADRKFLRDTFDFSAVDAGDGWLILALPPAELGVHPAATKFVQQHGTLELLGCVLYLMCDDVEREIQRLESKRVTCSKTEHAEWGISTTILLPSGGRIGLYQPTHATAV
jgi:hypothetical protein